MPATAGPLLSDTRLGRARPPTRSLRQPLRQRPMSAPSRPLGSAKSCSELDSPRPATGGMMPVQQQRPQHPLRRAVSLHSVLPTQHVQQQSPAGAPRAPAAPANSAIAIASPFRGQQYVPQQLQHQQPAAAPQPRLPRTTRPATNAPSRPADPVAVSASASATRVPGVARPAPKPVVVGGGKPVRAGQKNVELVDNPDDYDEGEHGVRTD